MSGRQKKIAVATAAVVLVVAGPIVASTLVERKRETQAEGARAVHRMLHNVPQRGIVLGRSDARLTLVVFSDLQCRFCAEWSRTRLPALVARHVRPGRLRIVFRGLAFIGRDSERGLRAVLAAGRQNRLWHLSELLFRRQGPENSAWLSHELVLAAARDAGGIDVERLVRDAESPAVDRELATASRVAGAYAVAATPSFALGPTGGPLRRVDHDELVRELERVPADV